MAVSSSFVPAPFWRRLVARAIDLFVCVPLTFVAVIPVAILMLPLALAVKDDSLSNVGASICFLLAYVLVEYFLLRRRSGQTLGKGLLGLKVIAANDPDGTRPLDARSALLRILVLIGPLMVAFAAYTGDDNSPSARVGDAGVYIWMAVLGVSAVTAVADRTGRRGLHDMAGRTRVVRAQRRGVDLRKDLPMLVPGRVSLEKIPTPPVILTK